MAISLGDRLRQVVGGTIPRVGPDAAVCEWDDRQRIDRPSHRPTRIDGHRLADGLAGHWIESGDGAVVVVDRYYTPDRRHGRDRIGTVVDTLEAGTNALDVLARAWPGWIAWCVLPLIFGLRHPAPADPERPLELRHRLVGIAALIVFAICFIPVPLRLNP